MIASEPLTFTTKQLHAAEDETSLIVNYHNIKKAALILRALNHKLRQQILKTISNNKKITVTELYLKLRLEQSVASQHLAILRNSGIVLTEREGKYIYYTINLKLINTINEFIQQLLP